MRRGLLVAGVAAAFLVTLAPAAAAHPLGNFTVNSADRIVVGADSVRVQHVVDTAEIPTLQLLQSPDGPDADRDGRTTEPELAAWSARECARLAPQLSLSVDGSPAPLTVVAASARSLPGQAGLATSRLDCTFDAGRPARSAVAFRDPTSQGRTGWKEVSATALCGRLTETAGLPEQSPSALLTAYPQDLLSSPLEVNQAAFGVRASGACRADGSGVPAPSAVLPRGVDRLTSGYTSFVSRQDLTLPVAFLAVLLSIALGCGHAVAPGHGKTVIAAYLVGQRGTKRQAVWLGATVTATHTAGVLLLGALLSLTAVAAPERFVPATEVASGLLLAGVGVFLLRRALRARSLGAGHAHGHHDEHDHPHEHDHSHEHDHFHEHDQPHEHGGEGHGSGGVPADADHGHAHEPPRPQLLPVGAGLDRDGRLEAATPGVWQKTSGAAPHSHGGKTHSHLPAEDTPLGWRTLATMGVAGGLVPSPSALVVLLGASALGRPVFGALLVVGYGVGMALTLTVAGLLLLRAQAALHRRGWTSGRGARAVRALPLATATVVLAVGGLVVLRGLLTFRGLG